MKMLRPLALGIAALSLIAFAGCADRERELSYKDVEIDEYKRQVKELEAQLYKKDEAGVKLALDGKPTDVNAIKGAVGKDVDVTTTPVEVHMAIESEVLFKSGSAALSSGAKSSLNKVVAVIKDRFPSYEIRVVGHTDDQKITRSKHDWNDNWDLSTGRARSVLLYLEERGIAAKKLGIEGFADQRPLVPNTNEASRTKNRRVEIVVVPPEASAAAAADKPFDPAPADKADKPAEKPAAHHKK